MVDQIVKIRLLSPTRLKLNLLNFPTLSPQLEVLVLIIYKNLTRCTHQIVLLMF